MTLNLPISFRTKYFEANNMIRDFIIEIDARKAVFMQFLKIKNVDLGQKKVKLMRLQQVFQIGTMWRNWDSSAIPVIDYPYKKTCKTNFAEQFPKSHTSALTQFHARFSSF